MFSCLMKRPLYVNNSLKDYCSKSTNESIRKLTDKYNLERNKQKLEILLDDDDRDEIPEFNFLNLLFFLSISSVTFYFYKKLK
jgi:hypothetical protein